MMNSSNEWFLARASLNPTKNSHTIIRKVVSPLSQKYTNCCLILILRCSRHLGTGTTQKLAWTIIQKAKEVEMVGIMISIIFEINLSV